MTRPPNSSGDGTDSRDAVRLAAETRSAIQVLAILLLALAAVGFFVLLLQTAAERPGEITVTGLEPGNATVDENDTLAIAATVENGGETTATEIVTLSVGEREERLSITLEPGDRETITREMVAGDLGLGNSSYGVRTESDETTATLSVESDRPPVFEVTTLEPAGLSVEEDRRITVSAEIENTGGQPGNQTVALRIGNETFVTETVTLGPGASTSFAVFNLGIGTLGAGEWTYGVYTVNDSREATLDVARPATLAVRALEPGDVTVQEDGQLEVAAVIENTGELPANRTVALRIDGGIRVAERVELPPGETTEVTFQAVEPTDIGIGVARYDVWTGDEMATGTATVEGEDPAYFEVTDIEPGDGVTDARSVNISATIENTGGRTATQTVELRINDQDWTTTTFELPPGESAEMTVYNIHLDTAWATEYEYTVATESESESATLRFER